MIVESIVGGAVIALAAIGMCSVCRRLRLRLACWLNSPQADVSQRETTLKDPTPSFTVELVRTVLEHQARREDQSRHQLTFLIMQMATAQHCDNCSGLPLLDPKETQLPYHERDLVACKLDGMVARTIRRLLPGLRR